MDLQNLEVSLKTNTDELMSLTTPHANDSFPVGQEGEHAISCYSCDCPPCEAQINALSCAEEIDSVDVPKALGCGESYTVASTEETCCQGHESQTGKLSATIKETNGQKRELSEVSITDALFEPTGVATEKSGICKVETANTIDTLGHICSEPTTLVCGSTGPCSEPSIVIKGNGTTHYAPYGHVFRKGETLGCICGSPAVPELGMIIGHGTPNSQDCGMTPTKLGEETHSGQAAGESNCDADTDANLRKKKYPINICLLVLDEVSCSMLLQETGPEKLSERTNDDESAEAMLKSTCTCKVTSDKYDCKKVTCCVQQQNAFVCPIAGVITTGCLCELRVQFDRTKVILLLSCGILFTR